MGVGCVLDLLAGVVSRAPSWMQHAGLEWLFRLGQEPGPALAALHRGRLPVLLWLVRQALGRDRPEPAPERRPGEAAG